MSRSTPNGVAHVWHNYWESHSSEIGAPAPAYLRDALLEKLRPSAGMTILEAGSGTGGLSCALAAKGASVTVIDIVGPAVTQGVKRANSGGVHLAGAVADLFRLPFPDQSFDAVFNSGVMEHFEREDIQRGLAEMARVVKRGGRLFVAVPSASGRFYTRGKALLERAGQWEYGIEYPQRSLAGLGPTYMRCEAETLIGVRWQTGFLRGWRARIARALVAPFSESSWLGAKLFGAYLLCSSWRRES